MNRPYFSLLVVAFMTVGAAHGGADAATIATSGSNMLELAFRFAIMVTGVLATRAMWQRRATAARLTALWAVFVLSLLVAQDVAVGFFREGLSERLMATGLMALVVGTVAWRARPSTAAAR